MLVKENRLLSVSNSEIINGTIIIPENIEIIEDNAFFSDDTILTMAILEAVLTNKDYTYYLKKYGKAFLNYKPHFSPYFMYFVANPPHLLRCQSRPCIVTMIFL